MGNKAPKLKITGEMAGSPGWGFRWGKTSKRLTKKFKDFEYDHFKQKIKPFEGVHVVDIKEDGKFELDLKMNNKFKSNTSDDWDAWENIEDVIDAFEEYCTAGKPSKEQAEEMAASQGVLELAWINKVELEESK